MYISRYAKTEINIIVIAACPKRFIIYFFKILLLPLKMIGRYFSADHP